MARRAGRGGGGALGGDGAAPGPAPAAPGGVVIENLGSPHPPLAAKGFEFAQGTAEGGGVRAAWKKEVELIAS